MISLSLFKSIKMNPTHIHLLLNHFPIVGTLIGTLLLAWGIYSKQNNLKSAAAAVLFAMALFAIPVYLTGEPAEESVEKLPGVAESVMKVHEDAATVAIWLMELTGLTALLALILQWKQQERAAATFTIAFVFSVIGFAAMARTGYYGGQIRHTEITAVQVGTTEAGSELKSAESSKEKHDDD